jgi:predicted nucleic acid-binding protein
MSGVFVDTVGLLALWNESDQWHATARLAFEEIAERETELLTTSFVLLECGNAAARKPYRDEASRIRDKFEDAGTLIWPTDADWQSAWNAYDRGEADAAGIVDHVSFVVMRRLGLSRAFTNDKHFRAAGFEALF